MKHSPKARGLISPSIVWLGDDFTGAAAVMEVLTFAGIPSRLFLDRPTPEQLADCEGIRAFGIATLARAQSPEWMDRHLPALFAFLDATGAELVHYKTCSTLDSAPETGSIGRAIELGLAQFGAATLPVVTAAPRLRRYQAFGTLFCAAGEDVYRLDRHPVMARHPVTPMREADVARHLALQTGIATRCLDLETLADPAGAAAFLDRATGADICTIDCLDAQHERTIGKLLWERRGTSRFVVGSQGIEYALVAHLAATDALAETGPPQGIGAAERMAVVSGSVSSVTADQISWAKENGFAAIRLDALSVCRDARGRTGAEVQALEAAGQALSDGRCPLIFTAMGPDDPQVARLRGSGTDPAAANAAIGQSLGRILKGVIETTGLRRVAVSGGDTSGHVCSELGIFALDAAAPTVPGAAICRAKSASGLDGLEIALKGGQMGSRDYFGWVREGGGER